MRTGFKGFWGIAGLIFLASVACGARPNTATRDAARERLRPYFERQHVDYPPTRLRIVAIKGERRLKLFAPDHTGEWRFLLQYPIVAASGKPGPKLREGDLQVPEGIYRIASLNPDSKFHLSMELNYPNGFDRMQARADGRKGSLGKDVMIHGKWVSKGCIALGDTAAEDVYVLVSDTGLRNIDVVLAPLDFRNEEEIEAADTGTSNSQPRWVGRLYKDINRELMTLGDAGESTASLLIQYADAAVPVPLATAKSAVEIVADLIRLFSEKTDKKHP